MTRWTAHHGFLPAGCGGMSSPAPTSGPPAEPNICYRKSVGGSVGPVGVTRTREFSGPPQAPIWVKPGK
jgi:hypothetical protein